MKQSTRIFLFLFFWFFTLVSLSLVQKNIFDKEEVYYFPKLSELKPDFISFLEETFFPVPPEPKVIIPGSENLLSGEESAYLKNFFTKLKALEKEKKGKLRILHYGDSIIWADILTSRLKENFQKDFGDGGRGAVPAFFKLERAMLGHKNLSSESAFTREKAKPWGSLNPKIGFTGDTFLPNSPLSKSIHVLQEGKKPWTGAGVLLRKRGNQGNLQLNVRHDSGTSTLPIPEFPDLCEVIMVDIPPSEKLSFDFEGSTGDLPYIDSFLMETDSGISYSPVSMMGIELYDQLITPEENFACGIQKLSPDLIILQYGVNESQNLWKYPERTEEFYRKATSTVLERFKKHSGSADILFLGPVERMRPGGNGKMISMPELLSIHEIEKEISGQLGIAYYNSISGLGGPGNTDSLVKKGIVQEDRTHLTRYGGDILADVFYTDFYNQYQKFLGNEELRVSAEKEALKKESNKAVNFTSRAYFSFLFLVFLTGFLLKNFPSLKLFFLLSYSYYFYMTWSVLPVLLLVFSTVSDYFLGLKIEKERILGRSGKFYLFLSLFFNLGLLFIFKYFNFSLEILNSFLSSIHSQTSFDKYNIILPVGISFYTFQTLSYTLDIYRGKMDAEPRFLRFALYVTFFPQLVAGPIVRAKEFIPWINDFGRHFTISFEKFSYGIFLILSGLFKKLGADWLGTNLVDRVYTTPEMYSTAETIVGIYGYAFQIYGDFSGYSDIAIGSAAILGFHLTENFNRPYQSQSITEFWRRWHISLGGWFRDYLYISLGGNRNHVYTNLFITMFLCGLWHGAAINFVIWGLYHGILLGIERKIGYDQYGISEKILSAGSRVRSAFSILKLSTENSNLRFSLLWKSIGDLVYYSILKYLRVLLAFHLVLFGWIVFRVTGMDNFGKILTNLSANNWETPNLDYKIISAILIFATWHISPIYLREKLYRIWSLLPSSLAGIATGILTVGIYHLAQTEARPFIYFQF
ncbi:MAG: hypothetical protein H7A24_12230 [Leptospiraceae bacterium]|nr:hypothetical protein [Leptospiraceae bacterium]